MTILEYPRYYPEDGGISGFLCAVFEAYSLGLREPGFRCSDLKESGSPGLFDQFHRVPFSESRALRVAEGIRRVGGEETWLAVYHAFLSDMDRREEVIYAFIRLLMADGGRETLNRLDLNEAVWVRRGARRTTNEAYKFLGILRFVRYFDIYYAPMEPDCLILPLMAYHFRTRLADQKWVIHDLRRSEALFWDGEDVTYETGVAADPPEDEDDFFAGLWKTYFSAAAIEERKNLDLQRRFVPLKYRSHMTEMGNTTHKPIKHI